MAKNGQQQTSISLSANNSNLFFTGLQDLGSVLYNSGAEVLLSGGFSYTDIIGLPGCAKWFAPIHQDPVTSSLVYVGGYPKLLNLMARIKSSNCTPTAAKNKVFFGVVTAFMVSLSFNKS